jgi:hypothetical protein
MSTTPSFLAPSAGERLFNRIFGFLVGLGLAPSGFYLLEVRGRKSGKPYRTPVDLLELQGKQYLVAPADKRNGYEMQKRQGKLC